MSKLAHSNQETMDLIERQAEDLPEPPSWYCAPCEDEIYARTCPICGAVWCVFCKKGHQGGDTCMGHHP